MKSHCGVTAVIVPTSPSMRREWIEITHVKVYFVNIRSPSMRREWIEIP